MASKFLYIAMLFSFQIRLSLSGQTKVMESVPDLYNSMYKDVDGYPCVRLLNISGEIGCSNPGRQKVAAPIVRFKDASKLSRSSTILLSIDEVQSFFVRIADDSSFARNIGGVLVESGADYKGFSPAHKFPHAEFASYRSTNYEWNPIGSGIMWRKYDFPVFLLSNSSMVTIQEVLLEGENKKRSSISAVAEFDLVMETMKARHHDSESCLKDGTCLPLGGYSVWSSLPPIINSSSDEPKPIILTVASMDSASFFRDKSLGADSPISGLISLLAAVDALSHLDGLDNLKKQLVFLVVTGESWGYLGSRRFLLELDLKSDAVRGLNNSMFDLVVEVGSVGKGFNQGAHNFYAHTTGDSSATEKMWQALKQAEDSLQTENITISAASPTNPGIPPSSLMAFVRKNSQTSGVVLEDFDTVFSNKFYNSHLDDISNINSSSITASASLLACALYTLATDTEDLNSSAMASIKVNASLVDELVHCLLDCDPGLSCELVQSYISPSAACPSHYVGVILDEPSSTPPRKYVSDVSRFVWNFLADRTSHVLNETASSVCSQNCSSEGGLCIKEETDGKGVCVVSTTRYVPAYSTRLKYEDGTWTIVPLNSSDPMSIIDPVWTESNWNTIGLRVYTAQTPGYDRIVLLGGMAITALAYLAIVVTRASIAKLMKLD